MLIKLNLESEKDIQDFENLMKIYNENTASKTAKTVFKTHETAINECRELRSKVHRLTNERDELFYRLKAIQDALSFKDLDHIFSQYDE